MKIYLPGPGHDKGPMLKARYEQLRQAGIKRTMSRELTVFLTEGMCAWMHAWLSLPVEITGGSEKGCYGQALHDDGDLREGAGKDRVR